LSKDDAARGKMTSCDPFRYLKHIELPEISLEGQKKLLSARVLLIGAGGLGAPIAIYLAAAGVGQVTVIDDDVVELSNLQRQILYTTQELGQYKADLAAVRMKALNPDCNAEALRARFDVNNADDLVKTHDVVVDGSDNFDTRYLANRLCYQYQKPLVSGAILQFDGQLSTFKAWLSHQPCYQCLYPTEPTPDDVPSCRDSAVFGPVPGVVATAATSEVLKEILNLGDTLSGHLITYNALRTEFKKIKIAKQPQCIICGHA